jgi:lysophospholipase L1-like esterase
MGSGNFKAVPIYRMLQPDLQSVLTTDDLALAERANQLVTKVVFGHEMPLSSVTERYFFDASGFIRSKADALELTDAMKSGKLFTAMLDADRICFIGDSVTEGTKNGGCPWYEPIEAAIGWKQILNYSKGGCTVSYMVNRAEQIPDAELYVVALGTNDVRYRDAQVCAMTADAFVRQMDQLKQALMAKPSYKDIVFIAPWYSTDGDQVSRLSYQDKLKLNEEYALALERYCAEQNITYIDANSYIQNILKVCPDRQFLLDWIHPNASLGVKLYSEAVLSQ